MDIPRDTVLHWTYWIYLEMFVAGVASGAYLIAAMLEAGGRGRSVAARAAHLMAFPLMMVSAFMLTVDLSRPERFWHMVLMSERVPLPIFKLWSPISFGSWLVMGFTFFAFISFMDALFDRSRLRVAGWRPAGALHGSALGLIWAILGGLLAIGVASYSGLLLSVTSMPGWTDTAWLGAAYLTSAALMGAAAILLARTFWDPPDADPGDRADLVGFMGLTAIAWSVVIVVMTFTLGGARGAFLSGWMIPVAILAFVLAGVVPFVARFVPRAGPLSAPAVVAALVLLGGLLFRYAIVMGPQEGIV